MRWNRLAAQLNLDMALSPVQKGLIGETEVSKILMMSSDGLIEVDIPASDDERRDREVHERGHFGVSLALQVKIAMHLAKKGGVRKAEILHIQFTVDKDRLIGHPLFWYVLGLLDREPMTFDDPLFLVDSETMHRKCYRKDLGKKVRLDFQASVSPTSTDEWTSFRASRRELGPRVLLVLRRAEKSPRLIQLPPHLSAAPGLLRVSVRHRRSA